MIRSSPDGPNFDRTQARRIERETDIDPAARRRVSGTRVGRRGDRMRALGATVEFCRAWPSCDRDRGGNLRCKKDQP